jgi:hypothetical protein
VESERKDKVRGLARLTLQALFFSSEGLHAANPWTACRAVVEGSLPTRLIQETLS